MYRWIVKHVHSPYATPIFVGLVIVEAFFFMPVGTLLAIYCLEKPGKIFYYATLAAIASTVGAFGAYMLGSALWDVIGHKLIATYITAGTFEWLTGLYQAHYIQTILLAGFLPIPYKLITLTAGFCKLPLISFLVCTLIARSARFYLLAAALFRWGEHVQKIIDRYFYHLVAFGIGTVFICGWLIH